jgi:hypothetical protein
MIGLLRYGLFWRLPLRARFQQNARVSIAFLHRVSEFSHLWNIIPRFANLWEMFPRQRLESIVLRLTNIGVVRGYARGEIRLAFATPTEGNSK